MAKGRLHATVVPRLAAERHLDETRSGDSGEAGCPAGRPDEELHVEALRICGKFSFGKSLYVTHPSEAVADLSPPEVTRGVERMNTIAPRITYPLVSFTRIDTVIGSVRDGTGLGENRTRSTIRRAVAGTVDTSTVLPEGGGGASTVATAVWPTAWPCGLGISAVTRTRSVRPTSGPSTTYRCRSRPR
jgi:hypothetical protein